MTERMRSNLTVLLVITILIGGIVVLGFTMVSRGGPWPCENKPWLQDHPSEAQKCESYR
jgi:hypothetical protein